MKSLHPFKITVHYLVLGGLWILLIDSFMEVLMSSATPPKYHQHYKMIFFLFLSASMIYLLLKKYTSDALIYQNKTQNMLQFMTTFLNTIPNPVFYKDEYGKYQGGNPAFFANVIGLPEDRIIGKTVYELPERIPLEFADIYHKNDIRVIRNGGVVSYEAAVMCADDVIRDFLFYKRRFRNASGQTAGIVGVMLDISERKTIEAKIQQSHAFLENLIDSIPDLIFSRNSEMVYQHCNNAFSAFIGKSKNEIIGASDQHLFPPALAQKLYQQDRNVLSTGTAIHKEKQIHGKKGALLFDCLKTPYYGPDGQSLGVIGIFRDITEKRKAEKEKKELEAQLRQTQKMEALGTLAGGIAHDFNNILSAIIGYTDIMLQQAPKESPLAGHLQKVLTAGERAGELVKQILTFSRQAEQAHKPVRVKLIVDEVYNLLRASLPATITIQRQIHTPACIMGDPIQIHQVLMNLCTNAGHAMRDKGGMLEISLKETNMPQHHPDASSELADGCCLLLTVRDTGCGIPPEVVERIFEPFFTTKKQGEGTGMGLAVVHGIVKNHGGTISVKSREGRGTEFRIHLPMIQSECRHNHHISSGISTGSERILFVDDEPLQIDLAEEMLGMLGYKVYPFTDSQKALEAFKENPDKYDVVLTDMTMPNMTGDALAREVISIRPETPVIICTGYSDRIDAKGAKALGIREFVMKPILMRDIATILRKVLDR